MSREENETPVEGRRGARGGREESVSGSACKKEQVSIYTASPRIKDPAEYVGKSRRVLVLLFLFVTFLLSLSIFLLFQFLLFPAVRPPTRYGPLRKLVNEPLVFAERSRRFIFLHPAYTFNVRQPFWADILPRRCPVPDRPSPILVVISDPLHPFFFVPLLLLASSSLKLFPRKLINERDRFWAPC